MGSTLTSVWKMPSRGNGKAPCDWLDESEGLVSRLRLVGKARTHLSPGFAGRGRRARRRRGGEAPVGALDPSPQPLSPTKPGERRKTPAAQEREAADRLPIPARDVERLARDPRRIVRGEIDDCGCDVARPIRPSGV